MQTMICLSYENSLRRRLGFVLVMTAVVTFLAARTWAVEFPASIGNGSFTLKSGETLEPVEDDVTMKGGTFTIGGGGIGFAVTLPRLDATSGAVQNLKVESASKAGDTGTGVQVTVGNFIPQGAGLTSICIGSSKSTGTNKFIINTFDNTNNPGGVNFTVGNGSELQIDSAGEALGYGSAVNITLNQGTAILGSGVDLINGTIAGSTGVANIISSGLTVGGSTESGDRAVISVSGGTLNLLRTATGSPSPGDYSDLTVGGGDGLGRLEIIANGTLNVGNLILDEHSGFTGKTTTGTLNVFGNLTVNVNFQDAVGVDTIVRGETEIELGSTYIVNGTKNNYQGKMTVSGTLTNDATADTILMGIYDGKTLVTRGSMEITGGSVVAEGGRFTISNADILISDGTGAATHTLHARPAVLDLSTSNVTVDLTDRDVPATFQADRDIFMLSYRQLSGMVEVTSPTSGQMKVTERAVIGSAAAGEVVALDVSGN
ncbi:MAG: hypothetical protein LIQ31_00400, partial [Planctomycetes bacterium]|nr:hypothetical protein [Planctomycetota bacterium]